MTTQQLNALKTALDTICERKSQGTFESRITNEIFEDENLNDAFEPAEFDKPLEEWVQATYKLINL